MDLLRVCLYPYVDQACLRSCDVDILSCDIEPHEKPQEAAFVVVSLLDALVSALGRSFGVGVSLGRPCLHRRLGRTVVHALPDVWLPSVWVSRCSATTLASHYHWLSHAVLVHPNHCRSNNFRLFVLVVSSGSVVPCCLLYCGLGLPFRYRAARVLEGCPARVLAYCAARALEDCPARVLAYCAARALEGCPARVVAGCPARAMGCDPGAEQELCLLNSPLAASGHHCRMWTTL